MFLPITSALAGIRNQLGLFCPLVDATGADVGPLKLVPTVVGTPSVSTGPFGNAVDTTSGGFVFDDHEGLRPDPKKGWSVSLFFQRTAASNYVQLFGRSLGDAVGSRQIDVNGYNTSGSAIYLTQDYNSNTEVVTTDVPTTTNSWFHLLVIARAKSLDVIAENLTNGDRYATRTLTLGQAGGINVTAQTSIGRYPTPTTFSAYPFSGVLSRVAYWTRPLTDTEAYAIRNWGG